MSETVKKFQILGEFPSGASSWNDLADKPFYKDQPFEPMTFDGDATGRDSAIVDFMNGQMQFPVVKISDQFIEREWFRGMTVSYVNSSGSGSVTIADQDMDTSVLNTDDGEATILLAEFMVLSTKLSGEVSTTVTVEAAAMTAAVSYDAPSPGTYVVCMDGFYLSGLTPVATVKTLSEEFLPEELIVGVEVTDTDAGHTITLKKANGDDESVDLNDGQTPFIGENGNWWIGETDMGHSARGLQAQADQNENDATVPGHILNRTHYIEDPAFDPIVWDGSTFINSEGNTCLSKNYDTARAHTNSDNVTTSVSFYKTSEQLPTKDGLMLGARVEYIDEDGNTQTITVNDSDYLEGVNDFTVIGIGPTFGLGSNVETPLIMIVRTKFSNLYEEGTSGSDGSLDYRLTWYGNYETGVFFRNDTIRVVSLTPAEVVHTLDPKYLPMSDITSTVLAALPIYEGEVEDV